MWLLYSPSIPSVHLTSVHDLPSRADGVTGIWLAREDGRDVASQLLEIRRQPSHAFLPVFVDADLPDAVSVLGDGVAKDLPEAVARAADWRPIPSRLPESSPSAAIALARYLYLRPFAALTPYRDYKAHQAYRYPLAECFSDGPQPESLVDVLVSRGWLDQGHTVDRLRKCDSCQSTHLNYVDICPACSGLNIKKSLFIHCFTCSHVALQEAFLAGGSLMCPKCHARLRHIGVDYNRPLEQIACSDCGSAFSEAKVVARCLVCDTCADPEVLPVMSVASYTLSDAGRLAAIEGSASRWFVGAPAALKVSSPLAFSESVEWMASLARRHGIPWFSLVGVSVRLSGRSSERIGMEKLAQVIDAFVERIREQMRDTDLLARLSGSLIWIALPHTDRFGGLALVEKINAVALHQGSLEEISIGADCRLYSYEDIPTEVSIARFLHSLGESPHGVADSGII